MSISIVDYLGDYVFRELIPKNQVVLLICNERCLVPSSLGYKLVPDLNNLNLESGIQVFRLPSDFQKGAVIGMIIAQYQNVTLHTARREDFSGIVPNSYLDFLNEPVPARQGSQKAAQKPEKIDEIYNEALLKIVKNILNDKSLRPSKVSSLSAQFKNLSNGVIISFQKKINCELKTTPDEIGDMVFNDLESEGVIRITMGKVEYDDQAIDAFFGFNKTRIFVPGHKKIKEIRKDFSGLKVGSPKAADFNQLKQFPENTFYQNQVIVDQFKEVGVKGYNPISAANNYNKANINPPASVFRQAEPQVPQNKPDLVKPPAKVEFEGPAFQNSDRKFPVFPQQFMGGSAGLTLGNTARGEVGTVPIIQKVLPADESFLETPGNSKESDLNLVDQIINEQLIEEIDKQDIGSLLKLFSLCNRKFRDYIRENNIKLDDLIVKQHVEKSMRFLIECFFTVESSQSLDELFRNLNSNGLVKLKKSL